MYVVSEEVGESSSHTQEYEGGHETKLWGVQTSSRKQSKMLTFNFIMIGTLPCLCLLLIQYYCNRIFNNTCFAETDLKKLVYQLIVTCWFVG